MGHDTHFLSRLTRVSDADVELAMSLYRDVPLVRDVVEAAPVPEDVTRVAIALDASESPPLVLVERSGKFVTCLAPGMKTDLPIISRAALDRALRAKEEAERLKEVGERFHAVWKKPAAVFDRCEQVDLETMELLLATAPLCLLENLRLLDENMEEMSAALLALLHRERVRARETPLLEDAWRLGWLSAHQVLIVAVGLRPLGDDPDAQALLLNYTRKLSSTFFLPWTLRAVWALAHIGKPLLPALKAALTQPRAIEPLTVALALGTMSLGHRKLEGEIRKVLERHKNLQACQMVLSALDEPANVLPAQGLSRSMGVQATAHLPEGDPSRYLTEEQVPDEYTLPLFSRWPLFSADRAVWMALLSAMPLLARAQAEDFYVPNAVVGRWRGLDGMDVMKRIVEAEIPNTPRREPRASNNAGRNAPCPCGSGRKFKKCCA